MNNEISNMVYVKKDEYDAMQERLRWSNCLEAAGVDGWEGLDMAKEIFNED